jgi:hypothetical protein
MGLSVVSEVPLQELGNGGTFCCFRSATTGTGEQWNFLLFQKCHYRHWRTMELSVVSEVPLQAQGNDGIFCCFRSATTGTDES